MQEKKIIVIVILVSQISRLPVHTEYCPFGQSSCSIVLRRLQTSKSPAIHPHENNSNTCWDNSDLSIENSGLFPILDLTLKLILRMPPLSQTRTAFACQISAKFHNLRLIFPASFWRAQFCSPNLLLELDRPMIYIKFPEDISISQMFHNFILDFRYFDAFRKQRSSKATWGKVIGKGKRGFV